MSARLNRLLLLLLCLAPLGLKAGAKPAPIASDPKLPAAYRDLEYRAQLGELDAQYKMGLVYLERDDVKKQPKAALAWLLFAAENDHPEAALMLGYCYAGDYPLKGAGLKKDLKEAARYFDQAARHNLWSAQHYLGAMYQDGLGVEKNEPQALAWLSLAYEHQEVDPEEIGIIYKRIVALHATMSEAERVESAGIKKALSDLIRRKRRGL